MTMHYCIKQTLPLFPDEVIKLWLEPYANIYGWPPEASTNPFKWYGILLGEGLKLWRLVTWEKELINLDNAQWGPKTLEMADGMWRAHIQSEKNFYSTITDGKNRYLRATAYFLERGTFPKPIVLLHEQDKYEIADGNHRFLAFRSTRQVHLDMQVATTDQVERFRHTLLSKWKISQIADLRDSHWVWVGQAPARGVLEYEGAARGHSS